MAKLVPRNEALRRAAEIRAAIIALLNTSPTPLMSRDISSALAAKLKAEKYPPSNFDSLLYNMAMNGLINADKVEGKKYYSIGVAGTPKLIPKPKPIPKPVPKSVSKPSRVELTINGVHLVIDHNARTVTIGEEK